MWTAPHRPGRRRGGVVQHGAMLPSACWGYASNSMLGLWSQHWGYSSNSDFLLKYNDMAIGL